MTSSSPWPARPGLPLDPLLPSPGTARDWLRQELARREYHPSLAERFWQWVQDLFDRVREASVAAGGFDPVVAIGVLLLLAALAAFVLSRLRANPSAPGGGRAVFTQARRSAAEHRALAQEARARGDWDTSVVESTRALAAQLFERGVVAEEVGATAHEISARAALAFPDAGERLARAALVFDETRYGDRHADEPHALELAALDEELRSTAVRSGQGGVGSAAVPR